MMVFAAPNCPKCGEMATHIYESLMCRAWLHDVTEGASVKRMDYTGDSSMCWDTQEAIEEKEGMVTLGCKDCDHDWHTTVLEDTWQGTS